jgi:glycolate oxidase iron-sulfur subunit
LPAKPASVAFQSPCSFQHGLRNRGEVERLLMRAGYACTPVADAHLCCGSAGTYSILQPELSKQLRSNKLAALSAGKPARIATANIGCLTHLASGTTTPVDHWIELIAERLGV